MTKNEKKENKLSRDLGRMRANGWKLNREYRCIKSARKNRLAYGLTKPGDEHIYCPVHNEMYLEEDGHFETLENSKVA